MTGNICPCCGYAHLLTPAYERLGSIPVSADLKPPYSKYFGMPSYGVCDCCGFEFGNDDEPSIGHPVTFKSYVSGWITDGAEWFHPEKKPPQWSLNEQLEMAGMQVLSG